MTFRFSQERLDEILSDIRGLRIAVVGDFFLDRYLEIDPRLAEKSVETGLEAYQVVNVRSEPGAAGTVARNLASLGIGAISAIGFTGKDGEGFELREALLRWSIDISGLVEAADRFTPTYVKLLKSPLGRISEELNRLDIKNRTTTPKKLEEQIVAALKATVPQVSGVVLLDQVTERGCGVFTERVIEAILKLAGLHSDKIFIADSRSGIDRFRGCILKLNQEEAILASRRRGNDATLSNLREYAFELARQDGRPVFLTLGHRGISVCEGNIRHQIETLFLPPPLDIVGAGDSATAGILAALCCGASLAEAAALGNIVASLTVQQIGTTGYASPPQVRARWKKFRDSGIL